MTFVQPWWLLLLGLAPFIVWLHSRKTRSLTVSSTLLWSRLVVGNTARPSRTRPWRNLPLLLQLMVLTFVSLALAAPVFGSSLVDHLVVIVDGSGSMRANDEEPTRFEAAVARVTRQVNALPPSTAVTILVAEEYPRALAVRTTDRAVSLAALGDAEAGFGEAGFSAAIEMAGATLQDGENTRILLAGDSEGISRLSRPLTDLVSGVAHLEVAELVVGSDARNLGWTGISVEAVEPKDGTWRIVGRVSGTSPGEVARIPVTVHFQPEGSRSSLQWSSHELAITGDGSGRLDVELGLPGAGLLELHLPGGDALPQDDVARVILLDEPKVANVLLIGPSNPPLERALHSVPGVELYRADALPADSSEFDLVIADRTELDQHPGTSTWWIAPGSSEVGGASGAAGAAPTSWIDLHPLSAGVAWEGLDVRNTVGAESLTDAVPLVQSGGVPLIEVRTGAKGREVFTHFAIGESNWADLPAFPAFVSNLVRWIEPSTGSAFVTPCLVGRLCSLPAALEGAEVVRIDEELAGSGRSDVESGSVRNSATPDWSLTRAVSGFVPEEPGVYRVGAEGLAQVVVVNAFFPQETRLVGMNRDEVTELPSGVSSSSPWRWLLVVALLLLVAETLIALAAGGLRGRRRTFALVLQGAGLALLLLALLDVTLALPSRESSAVVVVDEEAVVASESRKSLDSFLAGLSTERSRAQLLGQISFSGRSQVVSDVGRWRSPVADVGANRSRGPRLEGELGNQGKDLWAALELATGMLSSSREGQIVLAASGLGSETVDPRVLQRVSQNRVPVNIFPLDPLPEGEVQVDVLEAPARVYEGDSLELRAIVDSEAPTEAVVRVTREGEVRTEQSILLQGGRNRIDLGVQEEEAGDFLYQLEVEAAADQFSQNNRGGAVVSVNERPRLAIYSPQPGWGEILANSLEAQGLETEVLAPIDAPWDLEGWLDYSAAIFMNVPAIDLHSTQQKHLETWVREHGGGLLLLGGENSFGPGGYYETELDRLSPLSSKIPREAPEVAILFVLDRSGSMQQVVGEVNRLEIAKQATVTALELLGEESRAGVVVFDSEAQTLTPVQPVTSLERFESDLARLDAGGGTSVYPALVEAFEQMRQVESATRHIVLMTDGLSQPGQFDEILEEMSSEGITLSTVAIGRGADINLLSDLARMGDGAFHATGDFQALPGILAQEALLLSSSPVEEKTFQPHWTDRDDSFVAGLSEELPALHGYVKTTAKPEAQVHLVGPEDDPLLASWQFGLGRVVSFASHGAGEWTETWLRWFEFPRLWSQAASWVLPQTAEPGLSLTVVREGGVAYLTVEASTPSGEIASGLDVEAFIAAPSGVEGGTTVPLREVSRGLYRGSFLLQAPGIYSVRAQVAGPSHASLEDFDPVAATVYHPYPARYQFDRVQQRELKSLALVSGGSLLDDPSQVFAQPAQWAWERASLWPVLALASLLLFLAALLLRYLHFGSVSTQMGR